MDFVEMQVTGIAHGGYGVGRVEGQVCFVPYALPDEVIRICIARRSKGVLWGEIVEVLTPSPSRLPSSCSCFGVCGGCSWLHFAYPAQGEWKTRVVQDCLRRIGGIETEVCWLEDETLRTGYRTRAEFHVQERRIGFYAAGSHTVIDLESCPLLHPRLNAALKTLRAAHPKYAVEVVVNPEGHEVFVYEPHTSGRQGSASGMSTTPSRLARAFPDGVGERYFLFDGVPVCNGAFSQSSLQLNRMLRRLVFDLVGEAKNVLDLYCGSGNFSLGLDASIRVRGIDHNAAGIRAAQSIAPDNREYRTGGERAFATALNESWDAVILDPPRLGAKEILPALATAKAERLIYVSCDPATLARDLKDLTTGSWKLSRVTAVDMFPNTPHVETVCLLERK